MSYRAAHEAVARFITAHEAAGAYDGHPRPDLAEHQQLRSYSPQRLARVLDPVAFVESRTSAGGTAIARRRELAAMAADDVRGQRRTVDTLVEGLDQARARLLHDARVLADEGSVVG
jgi:argininosuccinate lyase